MQMHRTWSTITSRAAGTAIRYYCPPKRPDVLQSPLPRALSMEHVRMRDNSSSPRPTENPTAPLIEGDPSILTPNGRESDTEYPPRPSSLPPTSSFHHSDKSWFSRSKLPRSKPLVQGFETPSFSRIAIFTVLCFIAYPAFYVLTLVARDKSLSIVRLIVSAWCSVVGFALGYVLLKIGAQHLEAASESTLVRYQEFPRVHFKQPGPL